MTEDAITADELADRLAGGDELGVVDVRDRDEFERWTVDGPAASAEHVPHARFLQAQVKGGAADLIDVPEPVVVVCGRGVASDHAAGLLRQEGVEAVNLEGGLEAWGDLYRARELSTPDGTTILQYHRPATGCLAYLVVDGGEAAVVDPLAAFADRYGADADERGAELTYAVDTHVHADHVSGIRAVAERTDATPAVPAGARDRGLEFDARDLSDGDRISVGAVELAAVAAPGHTTEMTALHVRREDGPGTLLTGDSLFLDGVARPDLEAGVGPEAAAARLYDTLHERFQGFSDATLVAPGHVAPDTHPSDDGTYAASLGALSEAHPLLALDESAFVERVAGESPPRPANAERIVAINLGRAEPDASLSELELGPNNCAAG